MRSSPMPVSTDGRGRLIRSPLPKASNCMKTRFQISMNRSPSASGEPGGPAGDVVPVIVEDLRARPARAGVAHRPEIVACRDADDPLLRQAGDLAPQVERFVVVVIDGDGELLRGQAEVAGQQIPGIFDRVVLEIIAEREIAQHLEECVVARGIADIVEIVVLAPGPDAFLRRRGADVGALLDAGEHVLELHHAGVGEHEGRVVARHERTRRNDVMPVPGEELEEVRSNVVDAAHGPKSPESRGQTAVLEQGSRKRQWAGGQERRNEICFPSRGGGRAGASSSPPSPSAWRSLNMVMDVSDCEWPNALLVGSAQGLGRAIPSPGHEWAELTIP